MKRTPLILLLWGLLATAQGQAVFQPLSPDTLVVPDTARARNILLPDVWWNSYSGWQGGLLLGRTTAGARHRVLLGVSYNTGWSARPSPDSLLRSYADSFHRFNFYAYHAWRLRRAGVQPLLETEAMFRDGLLRLRWEGQHWQRDAAGHWHGFAGGYRWLYRPRDAWRDYLIAPDLWQTAAAQAYFWGSYTHYRRLPGAGWYAGSLGARATAPGSGVAYAWLQGEVQAALPWRGFRLRSRLFGRYGGGQPPVESQLYLAGGSPEDMYESAFLRGRGWVPQAMLDTDLGRRTYHLHYGGGLGLRGYSGYRAEFADAEPAFYGQSGLALNLELAFDDWIPLSLPPLAQYFDLDLYAFYDVGILGRNASTRAFDRVELDKLRQDAGLGLAVHLRPDVLLTEPLTLRLDLPIFLSRPPAVEDYIAFRWMLGIGQAF
ncbi:MAG: hypothetical protein OHK0039_48140 [Bacteroidia bacterium]